MDATWYGALAQLGERYDGIVEVSGSIPLGSTTLNHVALGGRHRPGYASVFRRRLVARVMPHILIIDDDPDATRLIAAELQRHGHRVEIAADGAAGLHRATTGAFDAITLDRMLPHVDGLSVVATLRERGSTVPVLMISALSDVDERIAGLRAGGDDYLIKPFSPEEMAMRVEALLRRGTAPALSRRLGRLEIDVLKREVRVDGEAVRLLQAEYRLLEFLADHAGHAVSRKLIFEKVWGYHFDPGANLINVHIARLRRKLERPGRPPLIATVKGEGYRLDAG